jgi:hypothetical protein
MRVPWKKGVLGGRPEVPEKRRPEEYAAYELADDRGLPHPLHEFAKQAAHQDERRYLREQ